jgi:hypothetical protein
MKCCPAIAVMWLVVGCGSSESSPGGPVFDGFVPTSGSAVIYTSNVCPVPEVGNSAVSGILLDFAGYEDSCGVLTKVKLCGNKANSTKVMALVLSGQPGASSIEPAGPGTYSFTSIAPTDGFMVATAKAVQDNTVCEYLPHGNLDMTAGTITITAVSDTQVSGSTDLHFKNGTVFQYSFDFPICTTANNLCDHLLGMGCTSYSCTL